METRALETWALSSQGLDNKQIAAKLGCSVRSIQRYQRLWRSDQYLWGAAFASATKRQHEQQRKTDPEPGQPVAAGFRLWKRRADGTRELIASYEPEREPDDTSLEGTGGLGMGGEVVGEGTGESEPINDVSPVEKNSQNLADAPMTVDEHDALNRWQAGWADASPRVVHLDDSGHPACGSTDSFAVPKLTFISLLQLTAADYPPGAIPLVPCPRCEATLIEPVPDDPPPWIPIRFDDP